MKKLILASALALTSIGVQAQTYGEIGYTSTSFKTVDEGATFKASPSAIRVILGYELSPNLAVEGMAAFGMSGATVKNTGGSSTGTKLKIDNAMGIYLKPKVKLNDAIEIFGRVGYARVKGTASGSVISETASQNGFSYGAGLSYSINPTTSLNVDYMQYTSKDGGTVNGFTFGVGYNF
jgi:outer membrane autotransporter protein